MQNSYVNPAEIFKTLKKFEMTNFPPSSKHGLYYYPTSIYCGLSKIKEGNVSETDSFDTDEETQLINKGLKCKETEKEKHKYPRAVFFILGNEFCERFCFYGMRTILTIYLTDVLLYNESKATVIFHSFIMLSYFTPLFGALVADSWLGKFRTIFYISIVYAIGNIILSIGSIPNELTTMKAISLAGLFTIAVGTGGIKPCVSAFGGDQFHPTQEKQRQNFFSIFYFAINSGSVLSTLLTPILRADVHCFGEESCFPLAYGVPAALMIVALVLFLIGKPLYKIQPGTGNIFASVFKCICHALSRKWKSTEKKRDHWLDFADDKFDKDLIKDIQSLLHVLWIFLPVPVFWALFDQTGSSWTLQATRMDGMVLGFHVKADQMQVMNALMIIVMIPLFDYLIYPLFNKCHLLKKPLQKMAVGGILSALAFVLSGFVELTLESGYPVFPGPGQSDLIVINNSPCQLRLNGTEFNPLGAFDSGIVKDLPMNEEMIWAFEVSNCKKGEKVETVFETFSMSSQFETIMLTVHNSKLRIQKSNDSKARTNDGEPKIKLFYDTEFEFHPDESSSFMLLSANSSKVLIKPPNSTEISTSGMTEYIKTKPGKYKLFLPFNDTSHVKKSFGEVDLKPGGIYIAVVYNKSSVNNLDLFSVVEPNFLSILWQIPAYIILTAGEIMFSITGLEFSYSQAPKSMKSVVQATWLLTVAFGNLIVMIIAKLSLFEKKSYEMFMFAILMGVDMLIFSIMATFYKYVPSEKSPMSGKRNEAYEEETDFNQ